MARKAETEMPENTPIKIWKVNPDRLREGYRAKVEGFLILINQPVPTGNGRQETSGKIRIYRLGMDKGIVTETLVYEDEKVITENENFKPSQYFFYVLSRAKVLILSKAEQDEMNQYERDTYRC